MNKLLFVILLFLDSTSFSQDKVCVSKENYKKYFFINGIQNSYNEAKNSAMKIKESFKLKSVESIYNQSETLVKDLKETFFLKSIEEKRLLKAGIIKELMENPKTYEDVQNYLGRLNKEKQNFIFTHSEGNLFANQMCELKDEYLKMDIISFATPSNFMKCNLNEKYALFKEDSVISWAQFTKPFNKPVKPNYSSSKFIFYINGEDSLESNFSNHGLEIYLLNEKVVSDLRSKLEKTESEIYKKEYSFNIAEIEIKEDNKIESLLNKAKDTKESLELWGREKRAFINMTSYSSDLVMNLNKKGFIKKILDAKIPATNEQEFADMIAYSLNSLNDYCKTVFPPNIRPLCNKVGVKDYFQNKERIKPYLTYNKLKDWKMMLSCDIASEFIGSTMPISLTFQKRLPAVLYNQENLEISHESESSKETSFTIGEISIQEKDSVIKASWIPSKPTLSDQSIAQDKMDQCNSISKLASPPCSSFLKHIESTYFSKN